VGGQGLFAIELLRRRDGPAARAALCDLLERDPDERVRVKAAHALGARRGAPASIATLTRGLRCPSGPVRLACARALRRFPDPAQLETWRGVLREDPAPMLRREALAALDALGASRDLAAALGDPVWRVRRAAVGRLARAAKRQRAPMAWLDGALPPPRGPREQGAWSYLRFMVSGGEPEPEEPPPRPWQDTDWWDPDPPVLIAGLKHLPPAVQASELTNLLALLALQDGYPLVPWLDELRALLARLLVQRGRPEHWVQAFSLLDEPRLPYVGPWLMARAPDAPGDLHERLIERAGGAGSLIWALSRRDAPLPDERLAQHADPRVRAMALMRGAGDPDPLAPEDRLRAAAWRALRRASPPQRLARRFPDGGERLLRAQLEDPSPGPWQRGLIERALGGGLDLRLAAARCLRADPGLSPGGLDRLQRDPDHRVRAEALTPARASELWRQPAREPSWRVLDRAAGLLGRPLSALAEAPIEPPATAGRWHTGPYFPQRADALRGPSPAAAPHAPGPRPPERAFGRGGLRLGPLAVSGRYGLPYEGHALAYEAGVRQFFWEPEYEHLTRFLRDLPRAEREALTLIGGSFAGEAREVRRDLERSLRTLGVSRFAIYLLFWVRSPARLSDAVAQALMTARRRGQVRSFGLSTHDRALAARAIDQGWEAIMVRHSAGHPSAEERILPAAVRAGAGVLTFSNLCYGQMLRPRAGEPPPYSAADCYRYSLSQPGVIASVAGPRTLRELRETLGVLARPRLDTEAQARMRAFARPIRGDTRRLVRWIRER